MNDNRLVAAPVPVSEYPDLLTSITLNLRVRDIGTVLSLLPDHGYEVEINIGEAPAT